MDKPSEGKGEPGPRKVFVFVWGVACCGCVRGKQLRTKRKRKKRAEKRFWLGTAQKHPQ